MHTDSEIQIFYFFYPKNIAQTEICSKIQVVHQVTGSVALLVHLPLLKIGDIANVGYALGETQSPVHGPVNIVIGLDAQDVFLCRLTVIGQGQGVSPILMPSPGSRVWL